MTPGEREPFWERFLGTFVDAKLVVAVLVGLLVFAGLRVAPFAELEIEGIARDPVPVDAIPDIGENQQIVFTDWLGRSPRDVEDQVTYPLTTALLGIPGVHTVRSSSELGFSSIYVIFEDDVEFYWSRSRVLEKLASLPPGLLPEDAVPTLGPDATGLGQVFWYTLEGRDEDGRTVGGWDAHELRTIQDWTVRYALQSVSGVSEVASIGGHVREYQVDVDPDAMRAHGVTLEQIASAVRESNLDVGARTMEINRVEYIVRGLGFVEGLADLEEVVVVAREGTPIRVRDVAHVAVGPADRRGGLDDEGAEAVGGVVVARYRDNPLRVIDGVKRQIAELAPGLPRRTLEDGTVSQVTIVPFYDRTELIHETIETLSDALWQEILITVIVVLFTLQSLRSAMLISALLPLGVLLALVVMKYAGVDANIMALGGIAIAIGEMVDIGIVFTENIIQHLDRAPPDADRRAVVKRAAAEVAPAVLTSVLTIVVSFLPVFALTAAEARLFAPLALTKTFAMMGALVLGILVVPAFAHVVLRKRRTPLPPREPGARGAAVHFARTGRLTLWIAIVVVTFALAADWLPFGADVGFVPNALFVAGVVGLVLGSFWLFERSYPAILRWVLAHKGLFLTAPALIVVLGLSTWLGTHRLLGWLPEGVRTSAPLAKLGAAFPGLGREYMPPFDEGAFLYMPSTMPHASVGAARDMLSEMDRAIATIPEVDRVVGKWGRVGSPLDPAPASMFETVITYVPEYRTDPDGTRVRQWRDHIRRPRDIWDEIVAVADQPGATSAPLLMPIAARLVMLQSGMRAPMGIKVQGPDLESIERFGLALEEVLRGVPQIRAETVFADRVVGKPYLEVDIDRRAISRYGLTIERVQDVLQVALGGMELSRSVEGRERYPIRVRYMREERDSIEAFRRVIVPTPAGEQIPLEQIATIRYERGPQMIKSEDTFLTSYVLFDKREGVAEVDAVQAAERLIREHIASGHLEVPEGVRYRFAGTYESQLRSEERLSLLVPIALAVVFLLLYLQFRQILTSLIIYSSVVVGVSGGFILLWLYGQPWFLDFSLFGTSMRDLFQVGTVNLSTAVWVGIIALVGVATNDGVLLSTYFAQQFAENDAPDVASVRDRIVEAGKRRIRPCLMTTATTILALTPVITSQGRGSDVMMPMALPSVGGMTIALITLFVVPVLTSAVEERRAKRRGLGG